MVGLSLAFGERLLFIRPLPLSVAVGVGNNPHAVALVGRTDGTSRNNKRLDGITRSLEVAADALDGEVLLLAVYVIFLEERAVAAQVSLLCGLYHREEASNVLTNDPSGLHLAYSSEHLRPEVAVIVRSASSSGKAEGLTRESACEYVNPPSPRGEVCLCDVNITV